MDRRNARACAMKLIYEWKMGGEGGDDTLGGLLELKPDESGIDFMNELVNGVKDHEEELLGYISGFLRDGWSLERLSKVDSAILLIAAYELKYTQTGASIIINEAVELANTYSTDKAGSFINGVLGNMNRSQTNA